ncbi:hypothetical protein [Streptomyces sp. NPDC002685]|uniref:competence protein CoiA family protein n=1 Tax=Streptomyces sp. NPDC002685 TaxID=3154540 RepID=UPI00332B4646
MTAEESDRHKAMKDFLARTAQGAGLEARVEKATKIRSSRPDVTITGADGLNLGCEAQYYNASPGTVLRRSKAHATAGLTPNWITHDDTFHLVDRANWMLTNQVTWREISNAADLPLVGGYRVLAEWLCNADAQRACPDNKVKTGCGKVHLHWDTPRRLDGEASGWTSYEGDRLGTTLGQVLVGAATGSVTSLYVPSPTDPRFGSHLWVPLEDRNKWVSYRGVQAATYDENVEPDDEIHYSGRDADTTCQFGETTWQPSAPSKRRGTGSLGLTLTVDAPATPAPARTPTRSFPMAPAIPRPRQGMCDVGSPRCGHAARFYAAGWRCDEHRP